MTAAPGGERSRSLRHRLLLGLAARAVHWERLWPRLAPSAGIVASFVALVLFDVLPVLPSLLHGLILIAFAGAVIMTGARAVRDVSPVSRAQARTRLERDSGLVGRPLAVLDDSLAAGSNDATAQQLWQAHQRRARKALVRLRVGLPAPNLAARDPWAVRAAVILVLVIAVVIGGGDAENRLQRALVPGDSRLVVHQNMDLWITPPAYTGLAPLHRSRGDDRPWQAPEGSQALVQLGASGRAPRLTFGAASVPFHPVGFETASGFRAKMGLKGGRELVGEDAGGRTLTVEGARGRTLARWPGHVLADLPPTIELVATPGTVKSRLRIPYRLTDDYGVSRLSLVFERDADEQRRVALPLPPSRPDAQGWRAGDAVRDLGGHPWAGLPVTLWLEAGDGLGQTASSRAIAMILPERDFSHPVARQLVTIRRTLNTPNTQTRVRAHGALVALRDTPERFEGRIAILLGLTSASERLRRPDGASHREVQDLLWEMALSLEDDSLSLALRDIDRLRDALDRALLSGAAPDSLERLMSALQKAMDRYMTELARQLRQKGMADVPPLDTAQTVGSDEIRDVLQQARELAEAGDTDGARRLLAELARLMGALQDGLDSLPDPADMKKARQALKALQAIQARQAGLHQQTFDAVRARERRDARLGRTGKNRTPLKGEAARQSKLSSSLRDAMNQLRALTETLPETLPRAAEAMMTATENLRIGEGAAALEDQAQALDNLQQAVNAAAQALSQQMGGLSVGGGRAMGSGRRDPFGRAQGPGAIGADEVKLPGAAKRHKARSILRELRRRAGQGSRPTRERDYLRRLLTPF